MSRLCLLFVFTCINHFGPVYSADDNETEAFTFINQNATNAFIRSKLIPQFVTGAIGFASVTYPNGVGVQLGNVLKPSMVRDKPAIKWAVFPSKYYTLVKTDPDALSRTSPTAGQWLHWLVVNIPSNNVTAGETVAEYIGAGPPKNTGLHRYVFLVYKQKSKLEFDEFKHAKRSSNYRAFFSVRSLAQKYDLGDPVAGNFYKAKYEPYPQLYEQLDSAATAVSYNMVLLTSIVLLNTSTK